MRQFIRLISLAVLLSTALFWLTQGAHTGWSQRYVTRTELDPVTDIKYPVKDLRFVPGVDFLGLSTLVSALIFSTSFMFRRRIPREISLSKETGAETAATETKAVEPVIESNQTNESNPEIDKDERLT